MTPARPVGSNRAASTAHSPYVGRAASLSLSTTEWVLTSLSLRLFSPPRLLLLRGLLRGAVAQRQRERHVDDGADDSDCFDPTGREQRRTHDRTDDARAGKQSVLKAQ